jgi:hypothetical protein
MKPEKKKCNREEAILEELTLLGNMMKIHEWTQFGQQEAEEEEDIEANLDAETACEEDNSTEQK